MVLRYSCIHEGKDGSYGPPPPDLPDDSKSPKASKSDIYTKVVKWLSTRTKKGDRSRSRSDEKHMKGRFGLKTNEIVPQVLVRRSTKKRLKLFLRRTSSSRQSIGVAVTEGSGLSPEEIGLPSSGYMSAASSLAHTPSPEQDHVRDQNSGRDEVIRSTFTHTLPQQRLSPTVLLPDPLRSRVAIDCGRRCFGVKSRTLSLEGKARSKELLSATWPPSGRHLFNFGEFFTILYDNYLF